MISGGGDSVFGGGNSISGGGSSIFRCGNNQSITTTPSGLNTPDTYIIIVFVSQEQNSVKSITCIIHIQVT